MKNQKKLIIIAVLLVLVLVIGGTYAWLRITRTSEKTNVIKAGYLSLKLDDNLDGNQINLLNQVPMSYSQGLGTDQYTFELTNDGTIASNYTIYLDDVNTYVDENDNNITLTDENRLSDNLIRILPLKSSAVATASKDSVSVETESADKSRLLSEDPGRILDTGTIQAGTTIKYNLRMWINSRAGNNHTEAAVMGKMFSGSLRVEAVQDHE